MPYYSYSSRSYLLFHIALSIAGSGKRALLDVIARRADGATRGQVLLNGSPLSKALFQQRCGYVTQSCTFVPGLTVAQTLHYTPTIVSYGNWAKLVLNFILNMVFYYSWVDT